MTIFYIDTTSSYLYTGIVRDNKLLCEKKENLGKDLSVYTVNVVDEMFKKVNVQPTDINKIMVVNGPGSFTGIRIGVTLAKIFAYTKNIPIVTVTSLECMAKSIKSDKLIVPIINARREACYASIFDGDKCLLPGEYMTIEKLKMMLIGLNKDYVFISNDTFSFETVKYDPDILNIVLNFKDKKEINPHMVNPTYLKLTEAEENRLKDND